MKNIHFLDTSYILALEILKLPSSDRLALVSARCESLQNQPTFGVDRSGTIQRMRGLLKTDQPAPTDGQVEKYL